MENKGFYMVYTEGERAPVCKHATYQSAAKEALRLTRELKKKTYVLTSLCSYELNDVKYEECKPYYDKDDLPF